MLRRTRAAMRGGPAAMSAAAADQPGAILFVTSPTAPAMSNTRLALALLLTVAASAVTVRADDSAPVIGDHGHALPAKGDSQQAVLDRYGEPTMRHAAVGGGTPSQPPITRWDYPGFSVFFEHRHVVDAVVPDAPAPLFNTDELTPAGG